MADYRRLLARYWVILTIAFVIGAAVALVLSLTKSTVYSSTASLNIADITQIEGSLGQTATSTLVPAQIAAAAQRTVTSDQVLGVAAQLLGNETVRRLRDNITTNVDPASDLLLVSAQGPTGRRAASIANTVASVTADQLNLQTRTSFSRDAAGLARQIALLPKGPAYDTIRHNDEVNYSRLQTLAVIASPAKIQQPADVPTSANSSRAGFYTVLGGIIGLILGLGIAFVREALDRTVHAPEDVANNLRLPIVGHVDEAALGTAPFLTANGGPGPARRGALERFAIIRRGVELLDGGDGGEPSSVLITSPGPEEGKTTVALSLACAFAAAGRRTALVEADLRRPVLAERLGIAADGGLAEYLRGSDTRLSSRTLELPSGSLQVVLAGASNDGAGDVLASRRFAEALAQLTQEHDVVVVDGPPMIPVADALEIVPVVDAYVICLRAGRTKLAQLTAARALLERLPKRPGGAVITGVTKSLYRLDGADGYYRETAA